MFALPPPIQHIHRELGEICAEAEFGFVCLRIVECIVTSHLEDVTDWNWIVPIRLRLGLLFFEK